LPGTQSATPDSAIAMTNRSTSAVSAHGQRNRPQKQPFCRRECACGIGSQAVGLAKAGFRVRDCDISHNAVERAQREASRRSLNVQFSTANMLDLTCLGESDFDALICMDNALPHLESADQLLQAAEQIRATLRPRGFLMASIRDYDQLINNKVCVQGPCFYSDEGDGGSSFKFRTGSIIAIYPPSLRHSRARERLADISHRRRLSSIGCNIKWR
jgi:SAM-dependent methyltransferase